MDLRALRKTASLLEHAKKPTFAVLNGISPHTNAADEAAKAITEQFKLEVAPIRMGDRVAYNRCLISGQTAQEFEPEGKAPPAKDGSGPDRSLADFFFGLMSAQRGHSIEAIAEKLLEVSPKAQERERLGDGGYALITAQNAAATAERGRKPGRE